MTSFQKRRRFLKSAGAFCLMPLFPVRAGADIPSISGPTMGTRYTVRIANYPDSVYLPKLRNQIDQVLESTDSLMSTYRPESELSRLNQYPDPDWFRISTPTARVLKRSLEVHRHSEGAFNPAVGNMVSNWGFGAAPSLSIRSLNASRETLDEVAIEVSSIQVRKTRPEVALDLSGIAKGDAVDRVGAVLESSGISNYIVEIGGEVLAGGEGPGGRGWSVGIEGPPGSKITVLNIADLAVATSGDYIQYFDLGGRRYSHLLDPHSGMPVHDSLTMVCVAAALAMDADAWSTALMVMGLERGREFALENRIAAQFVYRNSGGSYGVLSTPPFKNLVEENSPIS